MRTTLLRTTLLASGLLLAGCSSSPPRRSGFLSDYSRLEERSANSFAWVDEEVLGRYDSFLIDPVEVSFHDEAQGTDMDFESLNELCNYTHKAMREALDSGYAVVAEPGPGVARIRIALTDIEDVKPLRKIVPIAVLLGAGKGGATMELEILDEEGNQLVAALELQEGSALPLDGLGELSDSKAVIDDWAKRLRSHLDSLHGERDGE